MIVEIEIKTINGESFKIKSDESFDVLEGEVVFNSIRNGEFHDAKKEINLSNYKSLLYASKKAIKCTNVFAELVKCEMGSIIEAEIFNAQDITKNANLSYIIELNEHDCEIINNVGKQLVERIVECQFSHECGLIGMRYLFHSLVKINRFDLAFKILNGRDFSSYGNLIDRGNTSLAEMWDDTKSRNHQMYADISSFFIKKIVGINVSYYPTFHIEITPSGFDELNFAKGSEKFNFGEICVEWQKQLKKKLKNIEQILNLIKI